MAQSALADAPPPPTTTHTHKQVNEAAYQEDVERAEAKAVRADKFAKVLREQLSLPDPATEGADGGDE